MTNTVVPAPRRSPNRSIAVVWPHDADAWCSYRRLRDQLEKPGTDIFLAPLDQLLDIEHGRCDLDAIVTIGASLDAARRVAARRDIPYIALGRHATDLEPAFETEPTTTPVFDVSIDNQLSVIALRTINISTLGASHDQTAPFSASSNQPGACRDRIGQLAFMIVDGRTIRLAPHTLVTVRHGSKHLKEHRL